MEGFIERLEETLKEKGISIRKFTSDLQIREGNIYYWKKNGNLPQSDVGLKIAEYLNVSLNWLITGEGFKFVSPAEVPEEIFYLRKFELDLFKMYEELTPEQKQVIKTMIKALYNEAKEKEEDSFKKTKSS